MKTTILSLLAATTTIHIGHKRFCKRWTYVV